MTPSLSTPRDADLCTVFDCQSGFFDADWNVQNGCEAPCPVVPNAECLLCQGPYVCKEQRSGRKEDTLWLCQNSY